MRRRTLVAGVASVSLGAVLLSVSAPSCGCLEPWMEFLSAFGVEGWSLYENLDAEVLAASANKSLIGRPLSDFKFEGEIKPSSCAEASAQKFDCEFWFIKGPIRERGFHVVVGANKEGKVVSVEVTNMHRVLGRWKFSQ